MICETVLLFAVQVLFAFIFWQTLYIVMDNSSIWVFQMCQPPLFVPQNPSLKLKIILKNGGGLESDLQIELCISTCLPEEPQYRSSTATYVKVHIIGN